LCLDEPPLIILINSPDKTETFWFLRNESKTTALKKTPAKQLSFSDHTDSGGFGILLSLIFRRLAIVNPPKANKFALLFKY
jgi:hypothetical protein